jgi:hypothetical protein
MQREGPVTFQEVGDQLLGGWLIRQTPKVYVGDQHVAPLEESVSTE